MSQMSEYNDYSLQGASFHIKSCQAVPAESQLLPTAGHTYHYDPPSPLYLSWTVVGLCVDASHARQSVAVEAHTTGSSQFPPGSLMVPECRTIGKQLRLTGLNSACKRPALQVVLLFRAC